MTTSPPPTDRHQGARRELIRLVGRRDIDGVRRLVYSGGLDFLSSESYQLVRRAATGGDMNTIVEHFVLPVVDRLHLAVAGDLRHQHALATSVDLEWLELVVPSRDFRQLARRLGAGDTVWLRSHAATWGLPARTAGALPAAGTERAAPIELPPKHQQPFADPATGHADPHPGIVDPPPARVEPRRGRVVPEPLVAPDGVASTSAQLTRDLFGDIQVGLPPPIEVPRRIRRTPRIRWTRVAIPAIVLVLAGWTAYLIKNDRDERAATETAVRTPATVAAANTTDSAATITSPPSSAVTSTATTIPSVPPVEVLLFASGSVALSNGADAILNSVVQHVKADPTLSISIIGYSDNIGNITTNRATSLRRAQIVRDALVARGVAASIIVDIQGAGPDTSVDAARARRVEVIYKRA